MNSPPSLVFPKVEHRGKTTIITFTGVEGSDPDNVIAGQLCRHTDDLAGEHLLLDFANVKEISSLELGTLIGLHRRMAAAGGRLTLFNLSTLLYEVFTVTRLHTLMEICRERPDA
jgi:anti-anti-sigma factor